MTPPAPLRVLLLDDREEDVERLLAELERAGFKPEPRRAKTREEYIEALGQPLDLILCDPTRPGLDGIEALQLMQQMGLDVPFIFVSGTPGEELAVEAMKHAATDYLSKDPLSRLGPSVAQALSRRVLLQGKRQAEASAFRLAAIIQSSSDGIFATSPEGVIVSWNPAAERLYGYIAAEVCGKSATLLRPVTRRASDAPDDFSALLRRLQAGEDIPPFETVRVRKDGRRVEVMLNLSPILDPAGAIIGISAAARDIGPRKRAERYLAVEHGIARILAGSATLDEAAPKLLECLAESLRWKAVLLWVVDAKAGVLRCVSTWLFPGWDAGHVAPVGQIMARGEGIPGRAWQNGEVAWAPQANGGGPVQDGAEVLAPAGTAQRGEPSRGGGLPLPSAARVVGVIEFHSQAMGEPEGPLRGMLESIASQVGQFIERRQSEAELRESEQRFRQLAENVREVFRIIDARDGSVLYVSPAYEAIWGQSVQSLYDAPSSFLDAVHPEDRQRVLAALGERSADREFEEVYRIVRPDGLVRWIWDRGYAIRDPLGEAERLVGIAEDITRLKEADETAFQLASIVQNSEDAIIGEDLQGRITSWNPSAERLFGYTANEVLGRPISLLVPPHESNEMFAILDRIRRGERVQPHETVRLRKDGTRLEMSVSVSPIRDAGGRVVGAAKIARDITAKKQADIALTRDAALLANVRDAVIVTDLDGIVTYWNEGATRLYGWSSREMLGRPLAERVPPDARAAMSAMSTRIAAGEEFAGEWEDYRKDGSRVWIDARVSRITDAAGQTTGLLGVSHDISARKRAEAERDALLTRLRMQIDWMPLCYILMDAEFRITDWNLAGERIFGYSKEEMLGEGPPFGKFVPRGDEAALDSNLARFRSGQAASEVVNENLTKDGRTITCQWFNTPLFEADGSFAGLISLAEDITARREAEDSLRILDRAIQAVSQGILITDSNLPDNPIVYASPSFERLTGYPGAEVVGRNCRFLQGKDTDPDSVARLREAVAAGQACRVELLNYRKDGTPFWNELSISPVRDGDGRLTHFVGVQTDVTERRSLEEQYRQSQKMEAIGQLAGGIAHDFNNLLTIISGYSELLLDRLGPGDPSRALVAEIHKAGERSASLTRQLLVFSRRQIVAPVVLDLNAVVTGAESMLRRVIGEDVALHTAFEHEQLLVKADVGQLEQVLMNLAVNARDAMPQGGRLSIETSGVGSGEARDAVLTVSDTGSGMTPEVLARIFEPFFTTKGAGKGTGLGLAVVHGIIKEAGGRLEVVSEAGVGTSVKVHLQRVEQPQASAPIVSAAATAPRGSETILLVEDEDGLRDLAREILHGYGYVVLDAAGGDEALRIAGEQKGRIHLVVTDVVMPGLGGRELAGRVLALHPESKVLYLSGYTDDAVVRHGIWQEQVEFLAKPFSTLALATKVRAVLDGA